jgi:hypothetical protein
MSIAERLRALERQLLKAENTLTGALEVALRRNGGMSVPVRAYDIEDVRRAMRHLASDIEKEHDHNKEVANG